MTLHAQCDFCGEPIEDDLMVRLKTDGHRESGTPWGWELVLGDVGHYHASEDNPCWAEMLDRLSLIHDVSKDLGPKREDLERRAAEQTKRKQHQDEYDETKRKWRRVSTDRREELLIQVLGGERLLIREVAVRINAELGGSDDGARIVDEYETRPLVMRLFHDGQLGREPETFNKTHTRYRYFRNGGPDAPIAELEQVYQDESEEA